MAVMEERLTINEDRTRRAEAALAQLAGQPPVQMGVPAALVVPTTAAAAAPAAAEVQG